MPEAPFGPVLQDALADVLETMFFVSVVQPVPALPESDAVIATLKFRGHPSGSLSVAVTREAAFGMTENFLGCDGEPEGCQTEEVVRELANMVCGSFLSRVEGGTHWELSEPGTVLSFPPEQLRYAFELDSGAIEVGLTTQD